ncbi:D12 class N6 adenine-specific DNA methyltransferase [Methyloglobulus morosus KoM1]|uniref:site-specific DNA-methyltransferase (adenine-specific) n=1 Tax=Methyloglobulus morosus KoM1 TaxID=1116472 RepID=V5DVB2_9GAMM|nr:DNA adenine methylase [Methyloglobulus morosus]ESS71346.1 D12 class N6 adenine-specific DNA methyltransferase [Methyloglobulus morosus KoM1]
MSTLNIKIVSPLRYPGSKATFLQVVFDFIAAHKLQGKEIVEPYAGSAIVSLSLVANGIIKKATLVERDPLIYSFWKAVFNHTDALISSIENVEVNIDSWHYFREFLKYDQPEEGRIPELALAGLFLNRTNFSGILHSGPVGGRNQSSIYKIDCRFNKKDIISRIQQISTLRESISVVFDDALIFLSKIPAQNNDTHFFYIDPPYFKEGHQLYRYHYKTVDHKRLSDVLRVATYPWLLSYDKHEFIKLLYDGFPQNSQNFRYMSKIPKIEKELVITNLQSGLTEKNTHLKSLSNGANNSIQLIV